MLCCYKPSVYKIRNRGETIGRIIHINRNPTLLRSTPLPPHALRKQYSCTSPKNIVNPMLRSKNSWVETNIIINN